MKTKPTERIKKVLLDAVTEKDLVKAKQLIKAKEKKIHKKVARPG
jgi:hypothetical protein